MGLFTRVPQIDARSLADRLGDRSVLVLDVRQPAEWRRGHIGGSVNLPLGQLGRSLERIPDGKTVVTVCASGHRSAAAARMLEGAGRSAENLKGGMRAWARAGLPIARV